MGGKILMTLLLQKPEIAEKAIVIDTGPYPAPQEHIHQEIADFMLAHPLEHYRKYSEITALIRNSFSDEQTVQLFLKNIRKKAPCYEWKVNAAVLREYLPYLCDWQISSPDTYKQEILFIKGELSDYIPSDSLSEILRYFPTAQLKTIPHASHRIHADRPEKLAEILTDFFLSKAKKSKKE